MLKINCECIFVIFDTLVFYINAFNFKNKNAIAMKIEHVTDKSCIKKHTKFY